METADAPQSSAKSQQMHAAPADTQGEPTGSVDQQDLCLQPGQSHGNKRETKKARVGDGHGQDVQPQPALPPPTHIRHAEKDRKSTCLFADMIARESVAMYRKCLNSTNTYRPALQLSYSQTVVATVVVCVRRRETDLLYGAGGVGDRKGDLIVVALGVGTKVLRRARIEKDQRGVCIRDCHAEVLCRRGFRLWLCGEILKAVGRHGSEFLCLSSQHPPKNTCVPEGSGRERGNKGISGESFASPDLENLESSPSAFPPWSSPLLSVREGVSFHFYTSSSPCGNSSWKRWAKGGAGPVYPEGSRGPPGFPPPDHGPPHPPMTFSDVKGGQVAALLKRNWGGAGGDGGGEMVSEPSEKQKEGGAQEEEQRPEAKPDLDFSYLPDLPSGCVPLREALPQRVSLCGIRSERSGLVLSCSDKLLQWSVLGLQGGLLSSLFAECVKASTLVVGRKFSKKHTERAVCCRLQTPAVAAALARVGGGFRISHPSAMTSGVKLDESVYTSSNTQGGRDKGDPPLSDANFSETRCLLWWLRESRQSLGCSSGAKGGERGVGGHRWSGSDSDRGSENLFQKGERLQSSSRPSSVCDHDWMLSLCEVIDGESGLLCPLSPSFSWSLCPLEKGSEKGDSPFKTASTASAFQPSLPLSGKGGGGGFRDLPGSLCTSEEEAVSKERPDFLLGKEPSCSAASSLHFGVLASSVCVAARAVGEAGGESTCEVEEVDGLGEKERMSGHKDKGGGESERRETKTRGSHVALCWQLQSDVGLSYHLQVGKEKQRQRQQHNEKEAEDLGCEKEHQSDPLCEQRVPQKHDKYIEVKNALRRVSDVFCPFV
uniref:A to I editase domain-containing protein n=1 Tax=Chromera velia CCMP2878 TaxID=1169474 RepID=A0A0G4HEC1_9ALVE|eukprot:Cvel_6530.t1-p1 / transcript=Cvel_6530.t1 / gene=Cvel_6530 / organism=Chromera_velia_CCMP2878 / gene_product=hypothetical protein / transcript_product=hypothetical protein / location=Cvel_scaffold321:53875-56355(+) / protein_length=827 / sequence_SO=supercontig / SO=protein_coding / is_pseudo=false